MWQYLLSMCMFQDKDGVVFNPPCSGRLTRGLSLCGSFMRPHSLRNLFVIIGALIKHATSAGSKSRVHCRVLCRVQSRAQSRVQCRAEIAFPRPPCNALHPLQRSLGGSPAPPAKKPCNHLIRTLGFGFPCLLQRTQGKSNVPSKEA